MLWPVFLLLGIERVRIDPGNTAFTPLDFVSYPWSHSLAMAVVWSVVFGGVHYLIRKDGATAKMLDAVVFSHWILDWVTHRPDLPLAAGVAIPDRAVALSSIPATVAIEGPALLAAAWWYERAAEPLDRNRAAGPGTR